MHFFSSLIQTNGSFLNETITWHSPTSTYPRAKTKALQDFSDDDPNPDVIQLPPITYGI